MYNKNLVDDIMKILSVNNESNLPLHNPVFSGNEEKYLIDCVRSNFVSSVGEYVIKFEKMLVDYTGSKYAVVAVNGTAALQVSLQLAGVEENDEVLIPALSFIATANAVRYLNAIPHFLDVGYESLGIDPNDLDIYLSDFIEFHNGLARNKFTRRYIKAIVPMHTFGHPVDMDALCEVASKFRLTVVEDAAESLGSFYKNKHTGTFGKVSALSFNGNKIITTGGGGAILTDDDELARIAKHITTTAKIPHQWEYRHDMVGYNFRMPAINAALGCAQLEQLPQFVLNKRKLADYYKRKFSKIDGVSFFSEPEYAKSNYWLNVLLLDKENAGFRDNILEETNNAGIMTRPVWKLLNTLEMYQNYPAMPLTVSRDLEQRIINIPSSAYLAENL
ncbi:MAG: LegC family aminotransferase [Spirochaetes bacterium]|nr:LegC family aminotransferase [Syntrophaceae bacterium]MBN2771542.1 LegC family aminotransferase [Spirochaetota bacterium]